MASPGPCAGCMLVPHKLANLAQLIAFVRSGDLPLEALDSVSDDLVRLARQVPITLPGGEP